MVLRLDPLQTTPPAVELEAASQILRDSFGMEASLAPLAGERDQNFRVDAGAGRRFLFKISNPADGPSIVDMQTAALHHIERVDPGLPVMRALPSAAGALPGEVPGPAGGGLLRGAFHVPPPPGTPASAASHPSRPG